MGYINNNTGYPSHTLSSRSVIKKNMYAVITPDGLVKNNIVATNALIINGYPSFAIIMTSHKYNYANIS